MDDDTLNKLFREHGEGLARIEVTAANTKEIVHRIEDGQARQDGWLADHESRVSTLEGGKLDSRISTIEDSAIGVKTKVTGVAGIIGLIAYQVLLWFRQQPPAF
ncbi:hypothetical protein LCGC14_2301600 [marine sediment metagenome]|uniref:Uncharacterized protein n=1 Tax=marine sediment metagenome TaxID=412755 RepID=A0A0F9CNU6_9ZZZZ